MWGGGKLGAREGAVEPAWNVFTACLDGPYPTPGPQLRYSVNRTVEWIARPAPRKATKILRTQIRDAQPSPNDVLRHIELTRREGSERARRLRARG